MPWVALLLLSQLVNPYAGVTWKGPLPSLDTPTASRVWARTKPDAKATAAKAPLTASDFKPAGPRTAAAALVAGAKGVSGKQAAALVEGLNAGIDAFEREARKNNVAHALAFLIGISLQVATDHIVTDAESERLALAINDELAASVAFKKTTAKERQLLYETCIVVGSLIGGLAAEAADTNDAQLKAQARQQAAQALAAFQ